MTLDDYPNWKHRFEIHINGVDTTMWMMIEGCYKRPTTEDDNYLKIHSMSDVQRKEYDAEKKAYAIMS